MTSLLANLLLLPVQVATILTVGVLVRRLLGVRVGVVRMMLAGAVALGTARRVLVAGVGPAGAVDGRTAALCLLLAAGAGSLVAMVLLVAGEVLVPAGTVPGPVDLWRGARGRLARGRRYGEILRIAVRHGLGRFVGRRGGRDLDRSSGRQLATSLRSALDEGGVTFVKLGQQLSARPDLLPPVLVEELVTLQAATTPAPWPEVAAVLDAELGRPVHDVFESIDTTPIAAASVAQTHVARLLDGSPVVVKIQRPGTEEIVTQDLEIMRRLARELDTRTTWGRTMGVRDLAAGFAAALREELDFTIERDNMRQLAASLRALPRPGVRIPQPEPGLSTRRVLVMERMSGSPLSASQQLLATLGPDARRRCAATLLDTVLDQVLVHGTFHVDLHPGNVLVAGDGTLELVDFGSVGRLDSGSRASIGHFLASLGRGDSAAATDALLELLDRPEHLDARGIERSLGQVLVRCAAPGGQPGSAAFSALLGLVLAHRLRVPPEVAAVFRTFATLEGTLALLDPDFDLVAHARQSGRDRLAAAMRPRQARQTLEDELLGLLPALRRLPRRVDRIADALEHGRLNLNVRVLADARDRQWLTDLVHRVLLTVLAGVTGLMAVILLANDTGPEVAGSLPLFAVLGHALLVVAGVLGLRVLVVLLRRT